MKATVVVLFAALFAVAFAEENVDIVKIKEILMKTRVSQSNINLPYQFIDILIKQIIYESFRIENFSWILWKFLN